MTTNKANGITYKNEDNYNCYVYKDNETIAIKDKETGMIMLNSCILTEEQFESLRIALGV